MRFYILESEGGRFGTKWTYADVLDPQNTEDVGPRCPVCGETVGPLVWLPPHRIKLEAGSWKGEDIFHARGAGGILVSERFKEIAERYKLKNMRLIPAERYAYEHPGRWYIRDNE